MGILVVLRLIKVVVIVPAAVEGTNVALDLGNICIPSVQDSCIIEQCIRHTTYLIFFQTQERACRRSLNTLYKFMPVMVVYVPLLDIHQ